MVGMRLKHKTKMKELGIWYFQTGWLIACVVGAFCGWLSYKRDKPAILWWSSAAILGVGLLMRWAKGD